MVLQRTRTLSAKPERHRVAGGTAKMFYLYKGDDVQILNLDGGQIAEIAAFDSSGTDALKRFGVRSDSKPTFLESCGNIVAAVKKSNFFLDKVHCSHLFNENSEAGSIRELCCCDDAVLLIGAVGQKMSPGEQTTSTDLRVSISRCIPLKPEDEVLPVPLGPIAEEFRIPKASARAYEVKAGQYIEITDVRGRQCSDFQAFHLHDLVEKQIEHGIDVTGTVLYSAILVADVKDLRA